MFEKIKNIFLKKTNEPKDIMYCRFLNGGITFMHSAVRACCSNKCGITFVDNYKGEGIDWKKINNQRKSIVEQCKKGILPENCKDCVELEKRTAWPENSLVDYIFLNYWNHCNCGCVYCIQSTNGEYLQTEKKPSSYYSVLKEINYLLDNNKISKDANVELVGGDLTVLDEADEIINRFIDYGVKRMDFHSSCIYYSQGIENALKSNITVSMDFSLDCGTREKYNQIKRIDAFDQVLENVEKYLSYAKPDQDTIVAKYIIVDGLNDNLEDFANWIELIHNLGIKHAKVDVNFLKYFSECNSKEVTVPDIYYQIYEYFNEKTKEYGIEDYCWEFSKRVMQEGGRPKGY